MEVKDSLFLKKYRKEAMQVIMKMHPEWDEKMVKKEIDIMIQENMTNPDVRLENNYTHEERDTTLLSVFDWCLATKPIIAGNGTFYKQHAVSKNPNALMLDEFLTTRKRVKKQMFSIEDESSRVYKMLDLAQGNWKKLANSYYGGSGMKASAFYNKFSGPSTTKSAQSVISTAMTTFESFLCSNTTFIDINECLYWINIVLEEKYELDDWIVPVSLEDTFERIANRVIGIEDDERNTLYEYMKTFSPEDITRLYYKDNLILFTKRHKEVQDLHDAIFSSVRNFEYMKDENDFSVVPDEYIDKVKASKNPMKTWAEIVDFEFFYDPNKVPDSIKEYLNALRDVYMKYVYVRYMYTDRIYKLRNFKRDVVTVIDTDSNILSLDTWMEYCLEELKHGDYGRDNWNNIFIAINTAAFIITAVITDTLQYYGLMSNVEEKYRERYSMKNEFFFSNLILAKVKKRYLSKVLLREGHRLSKPKYDVKGYDFKKASTSEEASNFFMHVVEDMILEPENVNIREIMIELQKFRDQVRKSLLAGERKYLPTGNAKELEAYENPEREQSVRGALAWNIIYPNKSVELPVKISILKTNIFKLEDIKDLEKTNPEIYQNIKTGIFEDKTGMFVKTNAKTGGDDIKGLAVLGIPIHEDIPEWIIPYIDYTTVINSVLAPFKSVTETFNLPSIEEGRTGRKTTGFTNIIKI